MTAGADEVSLGRGDSGTSLRMRETLHQTAHCTGEPWRVTAASAKLLKQALASDRVRSGLSPAGGVWATPSPAAGRSRSGPRKPIVPGPGTRDRPRRLLSGREEPPGLPPRGVSEARGHRGHAEPAEPAPGPGSTRALRPVAPWLRAPPVGRGRRRWAEARTLEGPGPGPGRPTSLAGRWARRAPWPHWPAGGESTAVPWPAARARPFLSGTFLRHFSYRAIMAFFFASALHIGMTS